jgi:type VI protein secretion system component VasK
MSSYVDLSTLRNVVLVSLIAGIGLTGLFSVAVRALVTADEHPRAAVGQRLLAAGCLLVVLAAVVVGLWAVLAK